MSREQVRALYDEWKRSKETQGSFLARKQLKPSIFSNYYKNWPIRRAQKKQQEPVQMLPVQVLSDVDGMLGLQELALELSNGKCLRFPVDTSPDYLSRLISAIESRCGC